MSALEIQRMPRQEKLKLMEILWAELSRDEAELESPAWHAEALVESRLAALHDAPDSALSLDEMKTRLRSRYQ